MKKTIALGVVGVLLLCGCASFNAERYYAHCGCGTSELLPGCACPLTDPAPAYGVARSSSCNDFPVSYRVAVPREAPSHVLPVDQPLAWARAGSEPAMVCAR